MIFPIVKLLAHAAWILFFETYFFCQIPVILTFFDTKDLCSRCAAHTQSN